MGQIRSKVYAENVSINGVTLGQPVILKADGSPWGPGDSISSLYYTWDDGRIGDGELLEDGTVVPDAAVEPA